MERLTNYYADSSLIEYKDAYSVKGDISTDSFQMFDNCTRSIFKSRGDTISPKKVICLETAVLNISLHCYPGLMYHIRFCIGVCAAPHQGEDTHSAISDERRETDPISGQAHMSTISGTRRPLDEAAIYKLGELLPIPLDSLVIKLIELEHYSDLLNLLPWYNRCPVSVEIPTVIQASQKVLADFHQI